MFRILFILTTIFIYKNAYCQDMVEYREKYIWNNKKKPSLNLPSIDDNDIYSLTIINYQDTVFPNDLILKYKKLKNLSVSGPDKYNRFTGKISEKSYNTLSFDSVKIKQLYNIEKLGLSGFTISKFPSVLSVLPNLKKLEIIFTDIDSIPSEINNFKNLTELFLALNKIKQASPFINSETIEYLYITNNSFTDLPDFISNLPNIQKVNISNEGKLYFSPCNMQNIDYIKNIEKLRQILEIKTLQKMIIEVDSCEECQYIKKNIPEEYIKTGKLEIQVNFTGECK